MTLIGPHPAYTRPMRLDLWTAIGGSTPQALLRNSKHSVTKTEIPLGRGALWGAHPQGSNPFNRAFSRGSIENETMQSRRR